MPFCFDMKKQKSTAHLKYTLTSHDIANGPRPVRSKTPGGKVNPLKRSGVRWLHFEVFSAIQV